MQDIKLNVDLYNPKYLPYLIIISPFFAGLGYFHNLRAIRKSDQAFKTLFILLFLNIVFILLTYDLPFTNYLQSLINNSIGEQIFYFCFRYVLPFIYTESISQTLSPSELKKIGISDPTYSKSFLGLFGWFILILIIIILFSIIFSALAIFSSMV